MPSSSRALYLAAKERANKLIQKQGRDISPDEFEEMVRMEPDRGTHKVRNTDSMHWKRWLAPEFRCIVPFASFAEFSSEIGLDGKKPGNTWLPSMPLGRWRTSPASWRRNGPVCGRPPRV